MLYISSHKENYSYLFSTCLAIQCSLKPAVVAHTQHPSRLWQENGILKSNQVYLRSLSLGCKKKKGPAKQICKIRSQHQIGGQPLHRLRILGIKMGLERWLTVQSTCSSNAHTRQLTAGQGGSPCTVKEKQHEKNKFIRFLSRTVIQNSFQIILILITFIFCKKSNFPRHKKITWNPCWPQDGSIRKILLPLS